MLKRFFKWISFFLRRIKMKKNFMQSQQMLLKEKEKSILRIEQMLISVKVDYQNTLNIIAQELGISQKELQFWEVSKDSKSLEINKRRMSSGKKKKT